MKEPIWGKTLFEEFFEKIERNQEAVAVHNMYSPAQIVSMVYANIEKCGIYQDHCREWYYKPGIIKTWSKYKAHFDGSFKETWISSRTLKTKWYAANLHAA